MTRSFSFCCGLGLLFLSGCAEPEVADPAALIPGWTVFSDREVGVEFKYPYTLELAEVSRGDGELEVALKWVGRGTTMFRMETRESRTPGDGRGSVWVGGKLGSRTSVDVDDETLEETRVPHRGKMVVFTGRGSTYEKVLETVKFLD